MTETRKRKIQNKNKTGGKNKKYKKRGSTIKYKKGGREYTKPQQDAIINGEFQSEEQEKLYKRMMDFYNIGNTTAKKIEQIYKELDKYDEVKILEIQDLIDDKQPAHTHHYFLEYVEYSNLVDKLDETIKTNRFFLGEYEKARNEYISRYVPEVNKYNI